MTRVLRLQENKYEAKFDPQNRGVQIRRAKDAEYVLVPWANVNRLVVVDEPAGKSKPAS